MRYADLEKSWLRARIAKKQGFDGRTEQLILNHSAIYTLSNDLRRCTAYETDAILFNAWVQK